MALPQTFIAIEKTMAAAMKSQWDKLARGIVDKLQPLLSAGKWAEAQDAVNKIDLDGVVRSVEAKIEELCVSALLFGAHHATGSISSTAYAKGKPLPPQVKVAIHQLAHMVEKDGRDYLCNYLHKQIEDAKKADPRQHMQKDSVYDAPVPDTFEMKENRRFAVNGGKHDLPDQTGDQMRAEEKARGKGKWQYPELNKDDISTEQLEETGGLQEPEQGEARPPRKGKRLQALTKTDGPKTLYVNRPILNAWEVIRWAYNCGFKNVQKPEDMHVTICYSKTPFDWDDLQPKEDNVTLVGDKRSLEQFGDAIVLRFESAVLAGDHQELRDAGASYDFEVFAPHVTITWEGAPRKLDEIVPFQGNLQFGPEVFAPINKDWQEDHEEIMLRKADASLADMLNDAVLKGKKVPIDTAASLTTSRLVSLGFLSQAVDDGVGQYQVTEILDDRTCPVCQYMHGKIFNVGSQHSRVLQALGTDDPADLKTISPWPGQSADDLAELQGMSLDEIQDAGYGSPPYHPGCRGFLVMLGSVDTTIPLGGDPDDAQEPIDDQPELAALLDDAEAGAEADAVEAKPTAQQSAAYEAGEADREMEALTHDWTPGEVEELKWKHLQITDPELFKEADDAFEAGDYAKCKSITDAFLDAQGELQDVGKEDAFDPEGPNAKKKQPRDQQAAGLEQDYQDLTNDSADQAMLDTMNDNNAPLDRGQP